MDEKESKRLQEEAIRLAEVLWAGRDDDTSRLLREGVRAMRERDALKRCPFIAHCQVGCQTSKEGTMDLRKRHDDLDARATQATAAEERALADFTGALEEVRQKIAKAARVAGNPSWETLVPAVENLATRCAHLEAQTQAQSTEVDVTVLQYEEVEQERDHWKKAHETAAEENMISARQLQEYAEKVAALEAQLQATSGSLSRANEERESILMALKTVRDVIVEADALIVEALGGEPTKDAEYASDLLDNVRDLLARHREQFAALQKEVAVFKESDKTQAAEWKRHVWNIAAALNVPRVAMGRAEEPNVDQIVKFINQNVLPTFQLAQRVSEIEGQLRDQEATTPPGTNPAAELLRKATQVECEKCGAKRIEGVEFCPSCGKD